MPALRGGSALFPQKSHASAIFVVVNLTPRVTFGHHILGPQLSGHGLGPPLHPWFHMQPSWSCMVAVPFSLKFELVLPDVEDSLLLS